MLQPALLATLIATAVLPAAASTDDLSMTLYRSDSPQLFSSASRGTVDAGYAIVHERRTIKLRSGEQTIHIDGLPNQLDAEALDLHFADDAGVRVLAQRVMLAPGGDVLASHVGDKINVIADGQQLVRGTLLAATQTGLTIRGESGKLVVVHDYSAARLLDSDARAGTRLQVSLSAAHGGPTNAQLTYPTAGLGWHAAYTGLLSGGDSCQLQFRAKASIANRSGRDWSGADVKLVAGEPNFAKRSGPRPVMMKSMAVAAPPAPYAPPQQAAMGAYRSYTLNNAVNLPDNSITQVPLYKPHTVSCQRTWLYENGNAWTPSRPMLNRDFSHGGDTISNRLKFTAFDSLPAGFLRVLGTVNGQPELLGEARIADTPKDQPVDVELGTAFDLRGTREQTAFTLDKAANTLDEAYRITVSNAGDEARTITVREHPNRWRNWKLVSSSTKPVKQTANTIDFKLMVPAHGKAHLDYALRYSWTAADE